MMRRLLKSLVTSALLTGLIWSATVNAQKSGPYVLWFDIAVSGSPHPGKTVYFVLTFTNAGLNTTSYDFYIDTINLTLPWQTFVETGTPIMLYPGERFYSILEVKIPDNQSLGNMTYTVRATWRYWTGLTWISGKDFVYESVLTISTDPEILRGEIDSLKAGYGELQAKYDVLSGNFSSLQASYDSLKSENEKLKTRYNILAAEHESTIRQLGIKIAELDGRTNLMYAFMITTIAFASTTVFFARRSKRQSRENNSSICKKD